MSVAKLVEKAIEEGDPDPYTYAAAKEFQVLREDVTPEQRVDIKLRAYADAYNTPLVQAAVKKKLKCKACPTARHDMDDSEFEEQLLNARGG